MTAIPISTWKKFFPISSNSSDFIRSLPTYLCVKYTLSVIQSDLSEEYHWRVWWNIVFFLGFSGLVPDHLIMNALAYQADPSCVDPAKLSPTPPRGGRRRSQARSMSVQSSLDPYGSSTTLNSESASSEIESSPRLSSDGSRGSPLGRLSNWPDYQRSRSVLKFTVAPKCLVQLCARMI